MSLVALDVRIIGQVQGVFFRAWTAERARSLDVRGWICNAADGSVEAHLEGDKASVQQLIDQLHQGSPSAEVVKVDTQVAEPTGAQSFEIRQ